MLLTVSGPPGGGKTTTAAELAEHYGLDHVSGGDIFRAVADERGLSLAELNELAESDETIDIELDQRLAAMARDRDDLVLESRLAGWLAGDEAAFRFWLDAPRTVRSARIADREGGRYEAVLEETRTREASEASRYKAYYDIDIGDRSIYDIAINTGRWSPEAVIDILTTAIDRHESGADEGKQPIGAIAMPE